MTEQAEAVVRKRKRVVKHTPDFLLIVMIILIVAFGIIMVYSASNYHAMNTQGDPFALAKRQGMLGVIGIIAMLAITRFFDYRILSNFYIALTLYIGSMLISLSVLAIGEEINGAKRWIRIGSITFQPSEIVKIAVIIMLSAYIIRYRHKLDQFKYIVIAGIIVIIPTGIVAIENLSSAIVIAFIGFLILFVSTPKIWYYVGAVILGVLLVVSVYLLAVNTEATEELPGPLGVILQQYRLNRIRVWQDPWTDPIGHGYQPIQSLYAVGSGGIFGKGLGNGIQKLGFLPEPYNDIIFAVICEELGLVGAVLLLLAYMILVLRGLVIASKSYDLFGSLVAVGISGMVGIQVLFNVAVNTNTIPTTGMQLPLVSYGGTALGILLCSLGILINISRMANVDKVN